MSELAQGASIRILVDNRGAPELQAEHGFAAWVEAEGQRILFDTGQAALLANCRALGVDLGTANAIVLSHGHYDHSGGLADAVDLASDAAIHVHPGASVERYACREGTARTIAMPRASRDALVRAGKRVRWTTGVFALTDGLGLSGPIPRLNAVEDVGGPFFLDPEGYTPDLLADDQALWMHAADGLIVLLGCAHAGLVNTLQHCLSTSRAERIHAVIGGFHLNAASAQRMAFTIEALRSFDPALIVPCHCTGDAAVERLHAELGERVQPGMAGRLFTWRGRSVPVAT